MEGREWHKRRRSCGCLDMAVLEMRKKERGGGWWTRRWSRVGTPTAAAATAAAISFAASPLLSALPLFYSFYSKQSVLQLSCFYVLYVS